MATNGGFLHGNGSLDATPTASTSASGYSIADAVDGRPNTVHRSSGTSLTVTWDFSAAKSLAGASIHNHNIPTGATVLIEFSTNNFSSTAATETMTPTTGADFFLKFASAQNYRYVRFNITVSSGYIQVGEYCLWESSYQFAKNYVMPHRRLYRLTRYTNNSAGQANIVNVSEQYGFGLDFRQIASTEMPYMVAVVKAGHVCFIPDMSAATCYHGVISESLSFERGYGDRDNVSFDFWSDSVAVS